MVSTSPIRTGMSQRASIKKFLEDGYSLTALEALSLFGAYRLAAHIEVLRNREGLPIVTTMNTDVTGRTYARYSLSKSAAVVHSDLMKRLTANNQTQWLQLSLLTTQCEPIYHA